MFEEDLNDDLINDLMNIFQTEDKENLLQRSYKYPTQNYDKNRNEFFSSNEDDMSNNEEILIDEILEKPIDILNEKEEANFYTYNKTQIKSIYWGGNQDSILPDGWVQVTHSSGVPLYLNRQSRVCTLSKPYYIGNSSARKHDIPINAVPCLAYRKRKEAVESQIKEYQQTKQMTNNYNKFESQATGTCPFATSNQENQQLETISNDFVDPGKPNNFNHGKDTFSIQKSEEKLKETVLTPEQLNEYCKRLFEFEVIKIKKFKTWGDRKKFIKKSKQSAKFPENAKLLKIQTKTKQGVNKEISINMTNKTSLAILNEYSSQIFKVNPRFEVQEKENPKDPFHAVVYINDKICGKGDGSSKKSAKNNAADDALCVLIPEFKSQVFNTKMNNDGIFSFFDDYNVDHTHVYLLSQKLGSPFPYDVLLTCLKYNFAINMARNHHQFIEEEIKPIKYKNCMYRMKLAHYDVEVNCTKKKEGRQLAAQKILKLMHPHILTWGSMLRLYGSKISETILENNQKETERGGSRLNVTDKSRCQQKAKPSTQLLEKLKEEMRKLRDRKSQNDDNKTLSENIVIATITNNLSQQQALYQDSILTIPSLSFDNTEFQLNSKKYLMNNENAKSSENNNDNNGKILLDCSKNERDERTSNNYQNTTTNKRKLNIYSNKEDTSLSNESNNSFESSDETESNSCESSSDQEE